MAQKYRNSGGVVTRASVRSKFIGVVLLTVFCFLVVLPGIANTGINWVNEKTNIGLPKLPDRSFNWGLDLQGGAHLIYQAKTNNVPSEDVAGSVEGVRDVIERRVRGGLGVGEPLVQTTRVGDDFRIIVELPGVTDVNQAIKMIGETPILEFKEENTEPPRDLTADEKKKMDAFNAAAEKEANEALRAVTRGTKFEDAVSKYSDDEITKQNGGDLGFISQSEFPEFYTWAKTRKIDELSKTLVKTEDGFNVLKKLAERDGSKEITAAHLLICYKGAERCDSSVPYSKEEALTKIEELKRETSPSNFTEMVKRFSTEPGSFERGGDLGTVREGEMVAEFEKALFEGKTGTIIGPVETQFGYHLIHKKTEITPKEYQVARLLVNTQDKSDILPPADGWKFTGLSGKQLKRAEVTEDPQTGQVQVSLQFNEEGTKLFSDITTKNVGKQVAIFLDNEPISIPMVNEPISTGNAVISGGFTFMEARLLAQRLNSGALPVPVELLSQQKVDATLGADSLQKSFKAGLAGLILVMIFMILYYRLPGLLSVFSLIIYTVLTLAIFKLLGVTLTLAGIAGFILSIGMAVDANVLVFERLKEELKLGKSLKTATEESFVRAWPSIRDGHITTLLGAVMLVWFGSGFIQGFAVVLGTGVIVSLFTAVTITRTIMRLVFAWLSGTPRLLFLGSPSSK